MRVQTSATTPRSWVMNISAVPARSLKLRSRSVIWACTVTSSAVVGSSAINNLGSQISAIAIITRCRMPPENWCGYSSWRRAGSGMPTRASAAMARSRASARLTGKWVR